MAKANQKKKKQNLPFSLRYRPVDMKLLYRPCENKAIKKLRFILLQSLLQQNPKYNLSCQNEI